MHFGTSPKQGREMEAGVLNRVRIFNPQRHPYIQTWVKYPPRGFNQMTAYYVYAVIQLLLFDSVAFFSEVMLEIVVLKKNS